MQTENNDFFLETEFLSDKVKVQCYTGLPNAEVLQSTFEFVVAFYGKGKKCSYYWGSFLIALIKLGFQDLALRMETLSMVCFNSSRLIPFTSNLGATHSYMILSKKAVL